MYTLTNRADQNKVLKCDFLCRVTARVEVHAHVPAAAPRTARQAVDTPSTMSHSQSGVRYNYGYDSHYDDLDDIVPERHHDWPQARQTRPATSSEPISVIFNRLPDYDAAVNNADIHYSVNDTSI